MAMAWEWYQRLPAGPGVSWKRWRPWGGTTGEPSSSVPSTSGGMSMPVPVDELRRIGVVDDVDGDGLAFAHAQNGAGRRAVVADGGDDVRPVEFDGDRRDAEGVVGFGLRHGRGCRGEDLGRLGQKRDARGPGLGQRHAAEPQEIAPVHGVPLPAGSLTCILSRSGIAVKWPYEWP